jgi:glycosyltransferase involved in cell wall biosynthesis
MGMDISVITKKRISPGRMVTAILPAYNEAGRIRNVLTVLREVNEIHEIIVVDDGSSDSTLTEAQEAATLDSRLRVIHHETNRGKGEAIFTGAHAAQTPHLLFLDSDLMNLKPDNISNLVGPVISGDADMTLGLFLGGRITTDLPHWINPALTGQRCLRAELIRHVSTEAAKGYGIEIAITIAAYLQHYRVKLVPLKGVWHPHSEFHRGFISGIAWRANMYSEILNAWKVGRGADALTERIIFEPTQQMRSYIISRYRKAKRRAVAILRR